MRWCRFGNTVLVHFEDMAHANLDRLLSQYRGSLACFSEDVQVRAPFAWLPHSTEHCACISAAIAEQQHMLRGVRPILQVALQCE